MTANERPPCDISTAMTRHRTGEGQMAAHGHTRGHTANGDNAHRTPCAGVWGPFSPPFGVPMAVAVSLATMALVACSGVSRPVEYLPAEPRPVPDACLHAPGDMAAPPGYDQWRELTPEERARAILRIRATDREQYESLRARYLECQSWALDDEGS